MTNANGSTVSVWMESEPAPQAGPLNGDVRADVCVVGAGISGLTAAYLLAREGKKVIVLDDGPVGGGQTVRTTAHLSSAIDDRYTEIERWHGQEGAKLAAASHTAAIDTIEQIVGREGIACDFRRLRGYLFEPPGRDARRLEEELQAARRAGVAGVEMLPRAPLPRFETGPCLVFPNQGQFHPTKYLAGLTSALLSLGGRLSTSSHVSAVETGKPAQARIKGGPTVTADAVIVATNTPINDRVAIHTKQHAYLTYVVALPVGKGEVEPALYWDDLDPYHYVRLQAIDPDRRGAALGDPATEELLIVGGEDHKTGQADEAKARLARLETWARERFPVRGPARLHWSGQVMETIDGLAFIGRNPGGGDNVYIATGDSGMGMTHGTIAGLVLTDLVSGRDNPWAALYDPARKRVRAAGEYLKENANVAWQYGSWLTGGQVSSVQDIPPGTGAVIRRRLSKVAAYRDEQGQLHEFSATCPHLGCHVAWNAHEKTWDCPCHGSRFNCTGKVINRPANSNLSPVDQSAEAEATPRAG